LEQSNAACGAIFQSGFQLAAPITFAEITMESAQETSGSFSQSTGQARNALAAAEIRFADRK